MAYKKYIEVGTLPQKKERGFFLDDDYNAGWNDCLDKISSLPAADVLPRDEAIKMGAELAAMHGSDATSQQLEEAYLRGVEYGMTRRDARPIVRGKWVQDCDYHFRCSICGDRWTVSNGNPLDVSNGWNFCPNCGSVMRPEPTKER